MNVAARQLMCVCRGCYLLFTDAAAALRYRAVPDRYLSFPPDFTLGRARWEALQIPVGFAFFFRNSGLDRTVAFYPGPAGATESELDMAAWSAVAGDPRVGLLADDVEALLVRVPDSGGDSRMFPGTDRRLLRIRRRVAPALAGDSMAALRHGSSSIVSSPGSPRAVRCDCHDSGRDIPGARRDARTLRGDTHFFGRRDRHHHRR